MALSRTANNVLVMDAINIASGNNLISFSPNNPVMVSNSLVGLMFADGSQQTTATSINSAFTTANSAFTTANTAKSLSTAMSIVFGL
jgi:hypothetical protein